MAIFSVILVVILVPILIFVVIPLTLIFGMKSSKNSESYINDSDIEALKRLEKQRRETAARVMTLQSIIAKDFPEAHFTRIREDDIFSVPTDSRSAMNELERLSNSIMKLDNQIFQIETFLDSNIRNWRRKL
ncbi:hypothetical protein [Thorsellia anophelis]|uniref:Phage shock protein B n=1 Tax=Thorsellia anophelis DSM 18579 TaxID=1123402 RepID=A0A1I0ANP8_9GAMM|nr:hypothetical protein [Thorsellia anophelis]SES96003.1 Phage shock protein B [Thorsellia anophelis DSM 18579]